MDGIDVLALGLRGNYWAAIGAFVFVTAIIGLIWPLLAREYLGKSGVSGPSRLISQQFVDDAKRLQQEAKNLDRERRLRLPFLLNAHKRMYFDHGHVDRVGLDDAWFRNLPFNQENCWQCGQPRFAKSQASELDE